MTQVRVLRCLGRSRWRREMELFPDSAQHHGADKPFATLVLKYEPGCSWRIDR
jgi:hypothetical protein